MKKIFALALVLFIGSLVLAYFKVTNQTDKIGYNANDNRGSISKENKVNMNPTPTSSAKQFPQAPEMQLDKNKNYQAIFKTSMGEITVDLNAKETPITVNNFVFLAKNGFYNNTVFHRTIKGFMIQGGDPNGNGTGGPGYRFNDEPFTGEYERGTIAMANSGPNTNGSQFFIMHQDYPLPKDYVIFGKAIKGLEVVDKIVEAPVGPNSMGEMSKPVSPVIVETIEIVEK